MTSACSRWTPPTPPTSTRSSFERHRAAATITTSNREPPEWLALMADPLLAQSAIDRLQSAAWELVLDGESYRHRQKPAISPRARQRQ
jgi:IstB-like ATP binding protein